MNASTAETFCVQQGAAPEEAKQVVAVARQRITVAADYTRDEQLGRAIMRLEDLYAKSIAAQDTRTALQAQRELNRLFSLYVLPGDSSLSRCAGELIMPDKNRQVELIEGYILPLGLAESTYPIEEHVRIAAELLRIHVIIDDSISEKEGPGEGPQLRPGRGRSGDRRHSPGGKSRQEKGR